VPSCWASLALEGGHPLMACLHIGTLVFSKILRLSCSKKRDLSVSRGAQVRNPAKILTNSGLRGQTDLVELLVEVDVEGDHVLVVVLAGRGVQVNAGRQLG